MKKKKHSEYFHAYRKDSIGAGFSNGGQTTWSKLEDLIQAIKDFQENPRIHNPNMSDENVAYWKDKKYIIYKVVHTENQITEV